MMTSVSSPENDQSSGPRSSTIGISVDGERFETPNYVFEVVGRDLGMQLPFIVSIGKEFELDFKFTNTAPTQVCELRVEVECLPAAEVQVRSLSKDFYVSPEPRQYFTNKYVSDKTTAIISRKLDRQPLQNGGTVRGQIGIRIRRIVGPAKLAGEIREIPGSLNLFQIKLNVDIWHLNEPTQQPGCSVITKSAVVFQPLPLVSRLRHVTRDEILVYLGTVIVAYLLGRLMSSPKESIDAVIQWLNSFPTETFFR